MQLMPVLLLAVVMAVDGGLRPLGANWGLADWFVALMACGPVGLIIGVAWAWMRHCDNLMTRGWAGLAIMRSERILRWSRWLILANHVIVVLVLGWVSVVRRALGDVIILDEFAAIVPPLLGLIALWWVNYPLDRRLRDALLIRRLDEGRPVYPVLSRFGYVMLQLRLQVLLMLVPLLLIVGLAEAVENYFPRAGAGPGAFGLREIGTLGAAAGVFLFSPLLARYILDVQPLPVGEVRDDLASVCARHRVKVRDMLLWNTNGSMINAAVMGLVSPLRYVMLTDALLESLGREQVVAVMAHEIGHVRRHHMPWLVVCLLASFVIAWVPVEIGILGLTWAGVKWTEDSAQWMSLIGSGVELVGGLLIFGWICRRFERQADTFAVQHLASDPNAAPMWISTADGTPVSQIANASADPRVTPQAALALCSALEVIAELNNVDPERPSWRHGSIAWRQRYLMSLIGRPALRLPIDRLVRWLKVASVVLVIAGAGLEMLRMQLEQDMMDNSPASAPPMLATPTIERPING